MVEKINNKPVKTYKAGVISLSVWENLSEDNSSVLKSFSFQRSYKDKDENWQHTSTLRVNDIPKLLYLLNLAYGESILN